MVMIGLPIGTIAIVLAWRFSERRQRDFVKLLLADDVASGTLTAVEVAAISGRPKDRRAYFRKIRSSSGAGASKHADYVLDAAIDLAKAIASTDDPHSSEAESARSEIARLRALPVA